jgi:hypothetical protein
VQEELTKMEESFKRRLQIWRTSPSTGTIEVEARKICAGPLPETTAEIDQQLRDKSFRKIFAILLLIERPFRIWKFVDEAVCDADLPLMKVPRKNRPGAFKLRRKNAPDVPLRCFKRWKRSTVLRFEEWQWAMLAPFFAMGERKHVKHYILQLEVILPFTSWEKIGHGGGFGQVFKANIHPDHHNFDDFEVLTTFTAIADP